MSSNLYPVRHPWLVRFLAICASTMLAVAAFAEPVLAQSVRGRSLSAIDSAAVPGVLVQLLSPDGRVVASTLSNANGGYVLTAPAAGTFQLRGLRIGYRPSLGASFTLETSQLVERSLVLNGVAVRLAETRVSASERCATRADTNSLGFRAWEQARTALASAVSTRDESGYQIDYVTSERRWRVSSPNRDESYTQREKRSNVVRTFRAKPLAVLADSGYVTRSALGLSFTGPDEDVLLSENFTTTHCIWAAAPDAGSDSIILQFEPTPERKIADIKGTLVLSRTTAELRDLRFKYVNVQPKELVEGAGGTISFLRLPTGRWIVREWALRSAVMREATSFGGARFGAGGGRTTYEPEAIDEARGEIYRVSRNGARIWAAPATTIRGRVTDRYGDGEANVAVRIAGFSDGVTTDSTGHFALSDVRPGKLTLELRPSYADSLLLSATTANIVSSLADSTPLRIAIPARDEAIADACARFGSRISDGQQVTLVRGVVRDGNDTPVRDVDVIATWQTDDPLRRGGRETRSTETGAFQVCGAPRGREITLVARKNGETGAIGSGIVPVDGGILLVDLRPPSIAVMTDQAASAAKADTGSATLSGTVKDRAGQPVAGVQVRVVDAEPVARTDARGEYVLRTLPAGRRDVEVRQLGFALVRQTIELARDQTVRLDIRLEKIVSLDSVAVIAQRPRYPEFESRRKEAMQGKFLADSDIARLHLQTMEQIVAVAPTFSIVGRGRDARVVNRSATGIAFGTCVAIVLLDDVEISSINDVSPSEIGAVELYPSPIGVPINKRSGGTVCGMVRLWTKR